MSLFTDFDLLPSLQATLVEKGLEKPTDIQEAAIPILLAERSVVGVSETGSGKTLAYVLPILHMLKSMENRGLRINLEGMPRACVIVPTRELGEQVTRVFKPFTHSTRLRVRSVLGGTTLDIAKRNIAGPFEILVATPGRLVKLLDRGLIQLADVRTLVFDEADQMLDQGFLPAAKQIVGACPPVRQLALFSATVSAPVQELMNQLFTGAEVIRSRGSRHLVPTLTTQNLTVVNGRRFPVLESLLSQSVTHGTLIFTNTREQCDRLAQELTQSGHPCSVYRGEMDKVERRRNLKAFRDGQVKLFVATDLASRGLDIEHVGRVINYHMPQQIENYIHRVGRTARAGRKGLVVNLITERDQALLSQVQAIQKSAARAQ
jgi:superfamily II DNA/RNA helicase